MAVSVKAERRDHRNDSLVEQRAQHLHVHLMDFAGELLVHALENADRHGLDAIGVGAAQIVQRKPFEDFMRHLVGRDDCNAQGGVVGDARAIEIGDRFAELLGKLFDLVARAVNDHDVDVQAAQHRDVQQQIAEIVVSDNAAIDRNDEHAVTELRDVMENPS